MDPIDITESYSRKGGSVVLIEIVLFRRGRIFILVSGARKIRTGSQNIRTMIHTSHSNLAAGSPIQRKSERGFLEIHLVFFFQPLETSCLCFF